MFVSIWIWQKYIRVPEERLLSFRVERGMLRELVRSRGEVAAAKNFELEFPFSGIVSHIAVREGDVVEEGALLMQLETANERIEEERLRAVRAEREANLAKLLSGPTPEDIGVLATKVANAEIAVRDARRNLLDRIKDAYTRSDDAVRNYTDQFFDNPRSSDPQLHIIVGEFTLETKIETSRRRIEEMLAEWKSELTAFIADNSLLAAATTAEKNLAQVAAFLDDVALAVNALTPTATLSRTTIDGYRAAVGTARTNVNASIINLTAAREKLRSAESNKVLADDELALKKSGTRAEDIAIAKSQLQEVEKQIAAVEENIRKSSLFAPARARVIKLWLEPAEFFQLGSPAISLASTQYEVQSDVSELDIGNIRVAERQRVEIMFDAFPDVRLDGMVVAVDEKPIVKDGDIYYRVHIGLRAPIDALRLGMRADVFIVVSEKSEVLKIPRLALREKDGKSFVERRSGSVISSVRVVTGISDGEFIEIREGLAEGDEIVISSER